MNIVHTRVWYYSFCRLSVKSLLNVLFSYVFMKFYAKWIFSKRIYIKTRSSCRFEEINLFHAELFWRKEIIHFHFPGENEWRWYRKLKSYIWQRRSKDPGHQQRWGFIRNIPASTPNSWAPDINSSWTWLMHVSRLILIHGTVWFRCEKCMKPR